MDDARSLSLFAAERVIIVTNAEGALPRQKSDEEEEGGPAGSAAELAAYLKEPSPGVTLLFQASRFTFEGDDKKRIERVRKFYSAIPDTVELDAFSMDEARTESRHLAQQIGLAIDAPALDLLVEALGRRRRAHRR